MADATGGAVPFGGCSFPMWALVNDAAEGQTSESFATHYQTREDGSKALPVFTTEEKAKVYAAAGHLTGHHPAPVHDRDDLALRLELFRARGGYCVRVDDPGGQDALAFECDLGDFIEYVRGRR